jgi:hypothetical protein
MLMIRETSRQIASRETCGRETMCHMSATETALKLEEARRSWPGAVRLLGHDKVAKVSSPSRHLIPILYSSSRTRLRSGYRYLSL